MSSRVRTFQSITASRSGAGAENSTWEATSGSARPTEGAPVVDMMEHRLSTREGWSTASCWQIIPPIDAPTTCAAGTPRASSRPAESAAMSSSR